ncbi:MAG: tryptophan synthase subunit alpha [Ktedonobacteraceae bacterium]|nr:tryptophan synthase subunit alpha [Ktedonobacteraceae bacterium]
MKTIHEGITPPSHEAARATKITHAFERAKAEGRGALIPYFMCGYPSAEQSVKLALAAVEGGADILELGMPFSDPLADGVTIQHAGHAALAGGMSIEGCMDIARQVAARCTVPLLLMGYYNPVMAYGIERFCAAAQASGISGLIVPDLPPEEAGPLQDVAWQQGLALIFLVPPTTPDERIAKVADITAQGPGGFIYCVSLSGVTGARKELPPHLRSFIARVQSHTKDKHLFLAVGFGLSTPEHVAEVTQYVDGAVVASAIVNLIDGHALKEQVTVVRHYIQRLCQK